LGKKGVEEFLAHVFDNISFVFFSSALKRHSLGFIRNRGRKQNVILVKQI